MKKMNFRLIQGCLLLALTAGCSIKTGSYGNKPKDLANTNLAEAPEVAKMTFEEKKKVFESIKYPVAILIETGLSHQSFVLNQSDFKSLHKAVYCLEASEQTKEIVLPYDLSGEKFDILSELLNEDKTVLRRRQFIAADLKINYSAKKVLSEQYSAGYFEVELDAKSEKEKFLSLVDEGPITDDDLYFKKDHFEGADAFIQLDWHPNRMLGAKSMARPSGYAQSLGYQAIQIRLSIERAGFASESNEVYLTACEAQNKPYFIEKK